MKESGKQKIVKQGKEFNMAKATDRVIKIIAKLDSTKPNGHSFSLDDGNGGPANLVFNKNDTNGMRKRDYYLIEFRLDNQDGAKLVFLDDRAKVLWACPAIDAVDNCPPDDSHMDTVFYVHPTKNIQDKKLFVINTDMDWLDFVFAFNFLNEGKDGPKYVKYDPGGSNKNGGIDARALSHFSTIALGVGAGLMAFFGAKLLLTEW